MMKTSFLPRPNKLIRPRPDLPPAADMTVPKPVVRFPGWDTDTEESLNAMLDDIDDLLDQDPYRPFPQAQPRARTK